MPRNAAKKTNKDFRAGFVTEATGLTYPENSLQDVDNCDIEVQGVVRRRLGLDQESNAYYVAAGQLSRDDIAVTWHIWDGPGNNPDLRFLVVQVGNYLEVLDYTATPISSVPAIDSVVAGSRAFDISSAGVFDFTQKGFVNGSSVAERDMAGEQTRLSSASGAGKLWFTSSAVVPFYLAYVPATKLIEVRAVGQGVEETTTPYDPKMRIRDFNGIEDGLELSERPLVLSDEHAYNLRNQSWRIKMRVAEDEDTTDVEDTLDDTIDSGAYPSNWDILWSTRQTAGAEWYMVGVLDPGNLLEQDPANAQAPRGHFFLDVLSGTRDNKAHQHVSDEPPTDAALIDFNGKYDENSRSGFRACAFFSGRFWLSGDETSKRPNGIYFSQILRSPEDSGKFYQRQDPTSENFTDLLATDGGVIYLPEAHNIQSLVPYGPGLCVFAQNGVWFIYGGEGGFTATNFAVEKISNTGTISKESIVRTDKIILYWSENSIYAVALPDRGIVPVVQDIASNTIFSFYNGISRAARARSTGCFDHISKKVFWCYLDQDSYSYPSQQSAYNKMLILDERSGAFTKYSFAIDADTGFYIGPAFPQPTGVAPQSATEENVAISTGDLVLVGTEQVVVNNVSISISDFINNIKVILLDGATDGLVFAEFYDRNFRDYNLFTSMDATSYRSYFLTPPATLEDCQVYKKAVYVHSFFERTETGFEIDLNGNLVATYPSGCTMQAHWDWHNTNAGNRWTNPQRAYRYRVPYSPTGVGDDYDTGAGIVYSKLKARGRGRALSLLYDSEDFKDFQCLGYSVLYSANQL